MGVLGLSLGGAMAGIYFSKQKLWGVWFGGALCIFLFILLINRVPSLYYQLPFSWVCKGRGEFLTFSVCVPMMFGTLIPRLKVPRQRLMVWGLAAFGTGYFSVMPFVETALVQELISDNYFYR